MATEKIDWAIVIGRFGEEQRQLQKEQNEAGGGWFKMSVWAMLIDVHTNEHRMSELSAMMRSCEQLILLDEIDVTMSSHFASVPLPISERALRHRLVSADSKDLSQETMQDAIDCVLSRLKRRVAQGTALFASLERFVAASHAPPAATVAVASNTEKQQQQVNEKDKEEIVPSVGVSPSSTVEGEQDGSCVIF